MMQDQVQSDINFFAKTNFRNKERIFGIKTDDRRRHIYIIGKTGMGKTNLIQNMAIQDIRKGKGVAIVDPHGEFAEECLRAIPSHRINDVVFFNPADIENPIAMNIMEKVQPEYRHLVASGLVGIFKKIWADSWGPRLEYLLRNAILALLEYPNSTLLGINRILVDKDYRKKIINKVTDPVVRTFWEKEFTKYHDRLLADAIAPIQNKVGQFLSSSLIRNIVGQTKSSFSVRELMDNQKILILNLSKGKIGEDNSALLGAMMITRIQLAAMARVDVPEEERKDFYLYVDEFQNFATESFANILSEARKYRLNLILAHQYIEQLDERVQHAIFGNVGTLITFRVGARDAEVLEKEFEPVFYATDIVNLAKYHIYLKLMIDGIAANPFSAVTLPPIDVSDTQKNMEKAIRVSRERFGTKREVVEDKINRWSGTVAFLAKEKLKELAEQETIGRIEEETDQPIFAEDDGKIINIQSKENNKENNSTTEEVQFNKIEKEHSKNNQTKNNQTKKENTDEKIFFKTDCWSCGIDISVPFEPDGKRPTFCKECLKNYRREQARIQNELRKKEQQNKEKKEKPNNNQNSGNNDELKKLIEKALLERNKTI